MLKAMVAVPLADHDSGGQAEGALLSEAWFARGLIVALIIGGLVFYLINRKKWNREAAMISASHRIASQAISYGQFDQDTKEFVLPYIWRGDGAQDDTELYREALAVYRAGLKSNKTSYQGPKTPIVHRIEAFLDGVKKRKGMG